MMRSAVPVKSTARMAVNMALPSILRMTPEARALFEQLAHGDRRPTAAPVWATLEVTREGFSTGALAARFASDSEDKRDQLNLLLGNSDLLARMSDLLHQGNYSIDLPEHAALLVVAWCVEVGDEAAARRIVDEIGPYMAELQFFPRVTSNAALLRSTCAASLGTVGDTRRQLRELVRLGDLRFSRDIARTASVNVELLVWQGDVVALLARTLGKGRFPCQGAVNKNDIPDDCAQPFQRPLPEDVTQMQRLLQELSSLLQEPGVSKRHSGRGGATALLRRSLELLIAQADLTPTASQPVAAVTTTEPTMMTARAAMTTPRQQLEQINTALARLQRPIREVMASVYSRWSIPGTDEFRCAQERVAASRQPRHHTAMVARLMLDALVPHDDSEVFAPSQVAELMESLPEHLRKLCASVIKALRIAAEGTLEELIDSAVIQSAEQYGTVCSRLVAKIKASTKFEEDVVLRRLYEQLQTAFNRRRSLVLAAFPGDFQSQVRLDELPWAQPLLAAASRPGDAVAPRAALLHEAIEIQRVLWTRFPATLIPNKVVRSLQQLRRPDDSGLNPFVAQPTLAVEEGSATNGNAAVTSGVVVAEVDKGPLRPVLTSEGENHGPIPLLEELAADIFGGCFSPKFTVAARKAAALLHGSLYCRYYALTDTYRALLRTDGNRVNLRGRGGAGGGGPSADEFLPLVCRLVDRLYPVVRQTRNDRSHSHSGGSWSVSGNGKQIEAAQIITTHNLIQLIDPSALLWSSGARCESAEGEETSNETQVSVARDAATAIWKLFLAAPTGLPKGGPSENWYLFKRASQHRRKEAVAWRQFVFALSLLSPSQQVDLLEQQRAAIVDLKRYERIRPRACELLVGLHSCVVTDTTDNLNPAAILLGWRTLGES